MKKAISFLLLLIASVSYAQDTVTLTDGRTVQAKVIELLDDAIKYKKFDNLEGPTYTVPKKSITKIKYANGSEDFFALDTINPVTPLSKVAANNSDVPEIFKGKFDVNNTETENYIEAVAKNAGAKVLEHCNGRSENANVDVFFGEVYRDDIAVELHIPIQVKWDRGIGDGSKSVRGEVIVDRNGKKTWKFQTSNSGSIGRCARGIVDL